MSHFEFSDPTVEANVYEIYEKKMLFFIAFPSTLISGEYFHAILSQFWLVIIIMPYEVARR